MLQLKNQTPFKASLMLLPDRSGVDCVVTVVKATFTIGDRLEIASDQVDLVLADEYFGEPATSSVRVPTDVSLEKPGTDVLVLGHAWAPDGGLTWQVDASVSVGVLAKSIRVFGDRVWEGGGSVARMSWVAPFSRMPLVWERAFGGTDVTERGPIADSRNPAGAGFRAPNGAKPLNGLPLPNIEDPNALIGGSTDAPQPACFAPVAPHWSPRRDFAGTYDAAWESSRSPFLPLDFDPRFCQVAPVGLSAIPHLNGGEIADLRGLTPDGALRFALPSLTLEIVHRLDHGVERRPARLDTVVIEPDLKRVVAVWRGIYECDKKVRRVREVQIDVRHAEGTLAI